MQSPTPKSQRALRRVPILDDMKAVEMFVCVVEARSITGAAKRLNLAPSTVSKKIGEIEARAGATLLNRTTRSVLVTDLGWTIYEHCLRIVDEVEEVEGALLTEQRFGGRLVVATSVVFGTRHLVPLISEFSGLYPQIKIKVVMSSLRMNMIEEGVDCSIRLARTDELGKRDRLIAQNRRVFCASPAYLETHGLPTHPRDLAGHRCLISLANEMSDKWEFIDEGVVQHVRVSGPLASDNAEFLREAAVNGLGVAYLGTFAVGHELRAGRLREILKGHTIANSAFVAAVPRHGYISGRVRLFVDHLVAKFGDVPPWDR